MQAQQPSPAPAQAPAAPTTPATENIMAFRIKDGTQVASTSTATPAEVLSALKEQRSELRRQLDRLESKRSELSRVARERPSSAVGDGNLARIKELDGRISAVDAQIATVDAQVAAASAVPGAIVPEKFEPRRTDVEAIVGMSLFFSFACLLPFIIAYSRRIWRRGKTIIAPVPDDVRRQLEQVTQAVDTIGLEVERIGEGQRFITKVLSEQGTRVGVLPNAAGAPVPAAAMRRPEYSTPV